MARRRGREIGARSSDSGVYGSAAARVALAAANSLGCNVAYAALDVDRGSRSELALPGSEAGEIAAPRGRAAGRMSAPAQRAGGANAPATVAALGQGLDQIGDAETGVGDGGCGLAVETPRGRKIAAVSEPRRRLVARPNGFSDLDRRNESAVAANASWRSWNSPRDIPIVGRTGSFSLRIGEPSFSVGRGRGVVNGVGQSAGQPELRPPCRCELGSGGLGARLRKG